MNAKFLIPVKRMVPQTGYFAWRDLDILNGATEKDNLALRQLENDLLLFYRKKTRKNQSAPRIQKFVNYVWFKIIL